MKIKLIAMVMTVVMIVGVAATFAVSAATPENIFVPTVKGEYIYGIPAGTNKATFVSRYYQTIIDIYKQDGKTALDSAATSINYIGTGYKVRLNGTYYTAVVYGDVNGDGNISSTDYMLVKRTYLGTVPAEKELKGAYLLAATNDNTDNEVTAMSYVMVKRACLNTYNINSDYTVPYFEVSKEDESGWTESWV